MSPLNRVMNRNLNRATCSGRGQYTRLHWKMIMLKHSWGLVPRSVLFSVHSGLNKLWVTRATPARDPPRDALTHHHCSHSPELLALLQRISTHRKTLVGQSSCDGNLCSMHLQNTGSPHTPVSHPPICEMQVRPSSSFFYHKALERYQMFRYCGIRLEKEGRQKRKVYMLRVL